jgi:hypothetical protein
MGFSRLDRDAKFWFLFGLLFLNLEIVRSDYFLREPSFEDEERRPRRAVPEWHEEWRKKARSFGQSPEEQTVVQQYIDRLNVVAREKHPNSAQARKVSNLDVSFCLLTGFFNPSFLD